jgi:RNA polymerase sigma factor (sigma-70 family)
MSIFSEKNINEIVTSCGKGDTESLTYFFEKYSVEIYNFPIRIFHLTEDEAGDYFIYTFERLKDGKKFSQFNQKSSFKTWFFAVLRNMLIDWKKGQKEVKTTKSYKLNKDGEEYFSIESETDEYFEKIYSQTEISQNFNTILSMLKVESRVLFKLAYIYYLNLNGDEIEYLLRVSNLTQDELRKKIFSIREYLVDRDSEFIEEESKLTYIFTQIQELESIKKKGEAKVFQDNLPGKHKLEDTIQKKREQRRKLLEKRGKSNFPIRTPFKFIVELLPLREMAISLALTRIIEKIEILLKNSEK